MTRGGKRPGAGRKQKNGEATTTVAFRVPVSRAKELKELVKAKLLEWAKSSG